MEASHEFWFDHEKREVYRAAITLIAWLRERFSPRNRCKFFDTAHASALDQS